jgi:hypothetical protein
MNLPSRFYSSVREYRRNVTSALGIWVNAVNVTIAMERTGGRIADDRRE